jgi:hypothetical protein
MGSEREKAAAAGQRQRHTLDSIWEETFYFEKKNEVTCNISSKGGCWIFEGGATENNRSRS